MKLRDRGPPSSCRRRRAASRRRSGWRCRRGPCRAAQHLVALHALTAGEHVHEGVVEGVTHVQAAGDVRRRQDDRVPGLVARGVGLEVAGVDPLLVELRFDGAGVPALGKGVGGVLRVLWRTGHPSIVSVAANLLDTGYDRAGQGSRQKSVARSPTGYRSAGRPNARTPNGQDGGHRHDAGIDLRCRCSRGIRRGDRAGRETYDKMRGRSNELWHNPAVQEKVIPAVQDKVTEAAGVVKEKAPHLQETVGGLAEKVTHRGGSGQHSAGSGSATSESTPATRRAHASAGLAGRPAAPARIARQ